MPPIKTTTLRSEIRFSQWLESMRKDVECTFGILKGRWRVLKSGIRLYRLKDADRIWKTCCALHNMLLEVDGLDDKWEDGHISSWQGELGQHDNDGTQHIPQAIRRLLTPSQARNYDTSGMGSGGDRMQSGARRQEEDDNTVETDLEGRIVVGSMSMRAFRAKLITHFNVAFKKREVKWPKRNGRINISV